VQSKTDELDELISSDEIMSSNSKLSSSIILLILFFSILILFSLIDEFNGSFKISLKSDIAING